MITEFTAKDAFIVATGHFEIGYGQQADNPGDFGDEELFGSDEYRSLTKQCRELIASTNAHNSPDYLAAARSLWELMGKYNDTYDAFEREHDECYDGSYYRSLQIAGVDGYSEGPEWDQFREYPTCPENVLSVCMSHGLDYPAWLVDAAIADYSKWVPAQS